MTAPDYTDLCVQLEYLSSPSAERESDGTRLTSFIHLGDEAAAAIRELESRARESAMQELASLGQAHDAYDAQLAAEAKLAEVEKERDGLLTTWAESRERHLAAEATFAALTARVEAMRGAVEWQEKQRRDAFGRRHITAPEDPHVYVLCKRYGFGAVMDAASRLWAREDSMGAFYIGGCIGMKPADAAVSDPKKV